MRQALRSYLLTQTAITNIVSTRIRPTYLPQNPTLPSLTYQQISGDSNQALDGRSAVRRGRVQIDAWAKTYDEAVSLAEAVSTALDGVRVTSDGVELTDSWQASQIDMYEDGIEAHRISTDYEISFRDVV